MEPVTELFEELPGYFDIVRTPMDMRTVKRRLKRGYYLNLSQFASDMRLIWKNAMKYNEPHSEVYEYASKLLERFDSTLNLKDPKPQVQQQRKKKISQNTQFFMKKKQAQPATSIKTTPPKYRFSNKEKIGLEKAIKGLSQKHLIEVWKICMKNNEPSVSNFNEIQLNIERLSDQTLIQINNYIKLNTNRRRNGSGSPSKPLSEAPAPRISAANLFPDQLSPRTGRQLEIKESLSISSSFMTGRC